MEAPQDPDSSTAEEIAEETTEEIPAGAAGEQGKDLERVTDRVETDKSVSNTQRVQDALATLLAGERDRALAAQARERELAAVKLQEPEDINLVAAQLELDKKAAERLLREHVGDVSAALRSVLHA
jgi:NACalpha-BTF3-like transcription factor